MFIGAILINNILFFLLVFAAGFFLFCYIQFLFRRRQLDLENQNRELHDFNAAKDKFISIIAHDLKTPAANIESLLRTLKEKFDELDENEKKICIEMLVESAKTHNDMLNTLLDLSRLRLGSKQFNPERLEARKLAAEVLEQTKLQAQQKQINQTNQANECFIKADKIMITTVIRNLVVNAIKFTNPGGNIIIRSEKKDSEVLISVTDTGIGIVDSKKDRIFGVDNTKSTTGTANETGTGLGLLLCKEYVERSGGEIWLESESGKGTTFFFTLPVFT